MSNRLAVAFAIAAVVCSVCIYGTLAQDLDRPPTEGAIIVGPPQARLGQELPGRYQLAAVSSAGGVVTTIVLDTHTGQCWSRGAGRSEWRDLGSPANE